MKILDLHGMKHERVEIEVENFVLLEELPVKIITGNSLPMRIITVAVLENYDLLWDYESHINLGAIVVIDPR